MTETILFLLLWSICGGLSTALVQNYGFDAFGGAIAGGLTGPFFIVAFMVYVLTSDEVKLKRKLRKIENSAKLLEANREHERRLDRLIGEL